MLHCCHTSERWRCVADGYDIDIGAIELPLAAMATHMTYYGCITWPHCRHCHYDSIDIAAA